MDQGGSNSTAQICESPPSPTLADSGQTPLHPPDSSASSIDAEPKRRTRSGNSAEGRRFGGGLAGRRKWPPRRVSFPSNDTHLVTGYLEPANPWECAENVNREDLISTYRKSCLRHNTNPLESVLAQLEKLDITNDRCETLCLRGQKLEQNQCESLEEILKRIQFKNINLEATSLEDESAVALFDMMEYYESAVQLNISSNRYISTRGWQACSHMIKKTQCLEQLEAKNVVLHEHYMPILSRALRIASHLQVLKLENCALSGRPICILVAALKLNTGLKELYLADNDLEPQDAMQLGSLLRTNNHLQLLDVSNNNIQDGGLGHISDGLVEQRLDDKDGKGLGILVLWNNHITRNGSQHISRAISRSKTLEMLNIGQNMLTNEFLHIIKDSLQQNRTLLRLGMQSTHLTCEAGVILSEIISVNHVIQRIDLRDNHLQIAGLMALAFALKKNKSVTQIDLDDEPRKKLDGTVEQYLALVTEIRDYCTHNEEPRLMEGSIEESESPEHRGRLSSMSSRKISLTCQTLPRSPPPIFSDGSGPGRTLLEPKRTSGGRLRSPAPSPIPSPVASPIPSPSRGRFVVSRVSESSLSSTNSSASSSPVNPPSSRSSSPTCFFPPATPGASRFRVTVVEMANSKPAAPKSVITSTNTNVTVGFQFRVETGVRANSQDSDDDVFKTDPETNTNNPIDTKNKPDLHVGSSVSPTSDDSNPENLSEITVKIQKTGEMRCVVKDIIHDKEHPDCTDSNLSDISTTPRCKNESDACVLAEVKSAVKDNDDHNELDEDKSISSKNENNVTFSRSTKSSCVQKPPSSLEKLLGLFQHPGSLFSSSANVADKLEIKNPLQNKVNTVMALGDKFHQYLRDGRGSRECSPQPPLQRSVSDAQQPASKLDPVKSSSVPQLSSLQALTSVFAPSNPVEKHEKDGSKNDITTLGRGVENPERLAQQVPSIDFQDNSFSNTIMPMPKCRSEDNETLNRISEQPLPEIVQSKVINNINRSDDLGLLKDLAVEPNTMTTITTTTILDTNGINIVNSVPVNIMLDNKLTICVPKLKDIPEYSVLDISGIEVEPGGVKAEPADNAKVLEKIICDSSTTDSINLTSDRNSSSSSPHNNIICDKQNVVSVVNLGTSDVLDHDDDDDGNLQAQTQTSPPSEHPPTQNISPTLGSDADDEEIALNICKNNDISYSKSSKIEEPKDDHRVNINLLENQIANAIYTDHDTNTGSEEPLKNTSILHNTRANGSGETRNANACRRDEVMHPESTIVHHDEDNKLRSSAPTIKTIETIFKDKVHNISYDDAIKNLNDIVLNRESLNAVNRLKQIPASRSVENDATKHQVSSTEESADGSVEFDRSDGDELIFNMTDISTDVAMLEDQLFSTANRPNDSAELRQSNSCNANANATVNKNQLKSSNSSQAVQSPTSLFIEKSKGVHRNSHDSGIEETNLSVSADSIPERSAKPPFQESTESVIDSEWSFAGVESEDSSADLIKDKMAVSGEIDTGNNNKDSGDEINESKSNEALIGGTESENKSIEKLLVEISSEGRDNEISGCSAVVCSISHQ
ncbi:uncharacterized protein LOC124174979 isoform X1 [Neodiprion fabricii]|uniref:uncharacterized protein LOC124174979 isoform X1 n=1 Tax=Neodiprion fabricii TaxID=2872261 RepID=UPI001ED96985|nr:uncharacterized protein LOC124174979 isoform X1 [Neodiprion fabricii]